jgi:hypothetical protein
MAIACRAAGHGPLPLLSKAAVASEWVGMVGVRSAWQPAARSETASVMPQILPDTSAVAVRHAVQVPDTRGRSAASSVTR